MVWARENIKTDFSKAIFTDGPKFGSYKTEKRQSAGVDNKEMVAS